MARVPRVRRVEPESKRGASGEGGGRQMIVWGKPEIEKVLTLSGYGMKQEQIALVMDVSPDTMREIIGRQPEVARAIERGLQLAASQIGQTLYQKALGYTVMRPKRGKDGKVEKDEQGNVLEERVYLREPDLGAAIWWEKTRMGYTDVKQLRHADAQGNLLPERAAEVRVYSLPDNGRQLAVDALGNPVEPAAPNGTGRKNGNGRTP